MGNSNNSSVGSSSALPQPKKLRVPQATLQIMESKPYFFITGDIELDDEEIEKNVIYIRPKTKNLSALENRTSIKHPNLLKSELINRSSRDSFPFFRLKDTTLLTFEAPPDAGSLYEIIKHRELQNEKFTEDEILTTLTELVSCLALFEKKGLVHGDINSETIFFDSVQRNFKIYDHALMSGNIIMGFWRAFKHHQRVFLSPELLKALEHKDCDIGKEKAFKSDIYALGMVLLETATLKDSAECYDLYRYQISQGVLDSRLEEVKAEYGNTVLYLIKEMLHENWEDRPSATRLFGKLGLFLAIKEQEMFPAKYQGTVITKEDSTEASPQTSANVPIINYAPQLRYPLQELKPNIVNNVHYRHFSSYVPPNHCYKKTKKQKNLKKIKLDYQNNMVYEVPFGTISATPRIMYVGGRLSVRQDYPPMSNFYRLNTDGSQNSSLEVFQQRRIFTRSPPAHSNPWNKKELSFENEERGSLNRSIVVERAKAVNKFLMQIDKEN